jgi:hypothetical protein
MWVAGLLSAGGYVLAPTPAWQVLQLLLTVTPALVWFQVDGLKDTKLLLL